MRKQKVIKPAFYTESERNRMVTHFIVKLMEGEMSHIITTEIKDNMFKFIKNGVSYETVLDLPEYMSVLEIKLDNNKSVESYINFSQK